MLHHHAVAARFLVAVLVVLLGECPSLGWAKEPPARDHAAVAAAIDREVDRALAAAGVAAAPPADDAAFLRRAALDLAGRIPTAERAAAFLDDTAPNKRVRFIDELLASSEYGRHLANRWRPLLAPRDPANTKPRPDVFSPWLADQFQRNRSWDAIAAALLGAVGDVKERPEAAFLMAHAENAQPRADLVAGAAGRAFLGVQLQCAECHDHPFAPWTQADFWGVAAFFGRLRNTGTKGPPLILTEDLDLATTGAKGGGGVERPRVRPGGAIVIPGTGGNKGAGREVPAKVLGGAPLRLDDSAPYRPGFIAWATGKDNPYFARAFVNRLWAQCFGRGLAQPLDNLQPDNPPSHPALLNLLADEFVASGFDIKHLLRCICTSAAYQRSSRSAATEGRDEALFGRMAIKPIGPEALYESLLVVYRDGGKKSPTPGGKPMGKVPAVKPSAGKVGGPTDPRQEFLQFFRSPVEGESAEFTHGIPQFLRRLNGAAFNAPAPLVDRLARSEVGTDAAVEALYLAALSRRPTDREREVMAAYVTGRPTPTEGYAGVLWVLLNSGEFVLTR